MHHVPAAVLAVQPTVELAKRFSRQRIDPLLEETPALRERVAPARARDSGNTMLSKEFPGGILVLTGANSAVGLRSMPARFLFLDEVDAHHGHIKSEGDLIALAEARARTFGWRRKAFLVSTPTIRGRSRIEREYAASDQRRFFLPSPQCGTMQWLKFERLIGREATRAACATIAKIATRRSRNTTRLPCSPAIAGTSWPMPRGHRSVSLRLATLLTPRRAVSRFPLRSRMAQRGYG